MISGNLFQLVLVDHLDCYLFAREHMPGRFDHCKMPFAESLFQIVHPGNITAVVLGRLNGFRLADHAATMLHFRTFGQHPTNPRPTYRMETILCFSRLRRQNVEIHFVVGRAHDTTNLSYARTRYGIWLKYAFPDVSLSRQQCENHNTAVRYRLFWNLLFDLINYIIHKYIYTQQESI